MFDVYKTVERLLEEYLPHSPHNREHNRYILSELDEANRIQIRTTSWSTHYKIQKVFNNTESKQRLENTYSESFCEGTKENSLEHGDIQVIDIKGVK